MLSLFEEITRDIASVSDKELARAQGRLRPINPRRDSELGAIHNEDLRRLYALILRYASMQSLAEHHRQFNTDTPEEEQLAHEEVHRTEALHKTATRLFWHQCREDIGGSAWTARALGIRENFMFVSRRQKGEPTPGAPLMPSPETLGDVLRSLFGSGHVIGPLGPYSVEGGGGEAEDEEDEGTDSD